MIVFAIIVFKTTALNRSATGPEKLRFPWCPPSGALRTNEVCLKTLKSNLLCKFGTSLGSFKDFELQGNFDCKKYVFYSENLPPLGYDGSIAYPRFDRKRVRSFGSQRVPPAKIKDSSRWA